LGMSILSGAHRFLMPRVVELLKEKKAEDIKVFGGGIIPREDVADLQGKGILAVFAPGASTEDIIRWVRENIQPKKT
jgi:methylmalonyl-CoA mutase, C-terminal domain